MSEEAQEAVLRDEIFDIVCSSLHISVPSADTDLLENGTIDSLSLIELLMQLERRYGIQITAENLDFDNFRSIFSIAQFVAGNR